MLFSAPICHANEGGKGEKSLPQDRHLEELACSKMYFLAAKAVELYGEEEERIFPSRAAKIAAISQDWKAGSKRDLPSASPSHSPAAGDALSGQIVAAKMEKREREREKKGLVPRRKRFCKGVKLIWK